jgi:uncharacterized phage-associated protein
MNFSPIPRVKRLIEDKAKIQEAILYLMTEKPNLSQYDIVKSLFLADRAHLNRYGRPVTFDNYVAMKDGPVPSLTYDALKPTYRYKHTFGEDRPWTSVPDKDKPKVNRYTALRKPDEEYLSGTDKKALDWALDTVLRLSFDQLRLLTHEDKAYKEAWARRGDAGAAKMRLNLLVEEHGKELEEELVYLSRHT